MCIAILKPKDKKISKEVLQTCFNNNKDGCGFAYCDKGTVMMCKYMKFDDFYNDYIKVENKSNMLIHFRIATHGGVNLLNTHPFKLNNRMALIHNGVISGYGDKENISDTRDFIAKVIGNISWKMWKNPSFVELVDRAIGYSKLVILDKSGEYFIVGEDKGEWNDGVWFSNTSYKPRTYKTYTSYSNNKQGKVWDMYGDESYDDWYARELANRMVKDNKKDDDKYSEANEYVIYKCKKCGKEDYFSEDEQPICDVCRSEELEEIGYSFNGVDYLFEDLKVTNG